MVNDPHSAREDAIREEQLFVDTAYRALDRQREAYAQRLAAVRSQSGQESAGEMTERDSFATHYEDNLTRLRRVENRLVLGRLDTREGETDHIGRIGLKDEAGDILLLDWRAPQSEPFYRATAAHPGKVRRRRHIQTRLRTVTGVEDELLDSSQASSDLNLTGEGALMAAMNAARDGKMNDIVATIQAEQDRIIRADSNNVLVVQGGPGTGKTAVALHRAAYLLYTHRERLARSGVLIVGPSPVFLRYIDQVLPSLGESDVVSTTIAGLVPGVTVSAVDTAPAAEIKGRLVWRTIAPRAVRTLLERPLRRPVRMRISGVDVRLTPQDVENAQRRARRTGKRHNEARDTYAKYLVDVLARQVAEGQDVELSENPWIIADVAENIDARREINLRWMPSSAVALLERLLTKPHLLAEVAPELSAVERAALARPAGHGITIADIALIDEFAEVLGPFATDAERHARAARDAAERNRLSYAGETMEALGVGGGIVSAELLAERMGGRGDGSSLAERAAADRTWTYGHVVVDEAQELSPMQWEMLIRRNPSRSMTVVGDLDQRPDGSPRAGWEGLLGRLADRVRVEELTVSYRTPAVILDTAGAVQRTAGVKVRPVRAARTEGGAVEIAERCAPGTLGAGAIAATAQVCQRLDARYGQAGTLGVIVPEARVAQVAAAIGAAPELGEWTVDVTGRDVTARIQVLTAVQSKGLEFDAVVLLEPAEILAEGPGNIYVAMTRPTQLLSVVSEGELPAGLTASAADTGV